MNVTAVRCAVVLAVAVCVAAGCAGRRAAYDAAHMGIATPAGVGEAEAPPDSPDSPISGLPPPPGASGFPSPVAAGRLTIQPDSLVRVSVAEDPGLDGSYPVNEIGAIQLGYVGPVVLFNRTEERAEAKITEILKSRDFRNATVTVRILRASYDKIRVAGAVNRPGLIRLGSGDRITLNDALLQAGGLKAPARDARVRIVRGGVLSAVALDLPGEEYSLVTEDGLPSVPIIRLRNNDMAYVYGIASKTDVGDKAGLSEKKTIVLLGEVRRQGVYTFSVWEPCTMMHLMFKIGGLPPYANRRAVRIVRMDQEGMEREFEVNVDRIMRDGNPETDIALQNGDRIIVPARRISLF